MFRVFVFSVAAACCTYAQAPAGQAAPPEVDSALRARVQKFYQAMVDKKFRVADSVVAEESKDTFYGMHKPNYKDFAIKDISYAPGFTEAKVGVTVSMEYVMPGHSSIVGKRVTNTTWKVLDGEWFVLISRQQSTPFGSLRALPSAGEGAGNAPSGPSLLDPEKTEVRLGDSDQMRSQEVKLMNRMGGPLTLAVDPVAVTGLSATLDRTTVAPGQTAILAIRWAGKQPEKPEASITIRTQPIPGVTTIRVLFDQAAQQK